jgi:indole-3-glycerol phosphate synthase
MSVLDDILSRKRLEVEARRKVEPEESLRRRIEEAGRRAGSAPRGFADALRAAPPSASGLRVIAEMKRASPSRGPIRPGADAAEVVSAYSAAGAAALSVLTDGPSFDGTLEDLARARAAVSLPVLRKDFLVDRYQVWEARAAGADAVLLIAAALSDRMLAELGALAGELGMSALVEVHDRAEMERAVRLGARLMGINNRDLRTLEVSLETTRSLLPLRPPGAIVVSESGFSRREEMEALRREGVDAFLVGESLMREPDPGAALRAITGGPARPPVRAGGTGR